MRASPSFLLHLLGFGLLTTSLVSGFVLDRRIRKESEPSLKLFTGRISRTIGLLSPFAALILLATGIANIQNLFAGSARSWYDEGWLVAKVVLYAVMLLNGTFYGPKLSRGRMKLLESMTKEPALSERADLLRPYNRQISLFFAVQALLLLLILFISVFGPGKHPGIL